VRRITANRGATTSSSRRRRHLRAVAARIRLGGKIAVIGILGGFAKD